MNVLTIDFRNDNSGILLVESLHDTGFAILRHHPIANDTLVGLYRSWQQFFESNEKHEFAFDAVADNKLQDGYYSSSVSEKAVGASVKDIKEFYHVVPGGRTPEHLAAASFAYRQAGMELGARLLGWVQRYTPETVTRLFSAPISESLSDEATLLRILHYPKIDGGVAPNALRAAAHEDINFLTLLPVAKQPGLQVQGKSGDWIDLQGFEGDLIVNIGDMLQEASGGYFPSTTHRVVNPQDQAANVSRISMPLFLTPRLEFELSERYTAGSYLQERLELIAGSEARGADN